MSRRNIVSGAQRARSKSPQRGGKASRRASSAGAKAGRETQAAAQSRGDTRAAPRVRGRAREDTREQLLETAGQVFSEKGYDATTSKEICERCGANVAAVVYHFGGLDNLYAATLQEARRRLAPSEALAAAVAAETGAEAKLRAFVRLLVQVVSGPATSTWAVRLISREVTSPTPIFDAIRNKEMQARAAILKALVCELTGLEEDDPTVSLSCINIMAPFGILMLIGPRRVERAFSTLSFGPATVDKVTDHLMRFALGGLAAVARGALPEGQVEDRNRE